MAGLLDLLRPQGAQLPGMAQQPSGLARILQPEVALPMAAALLGNQGNMQNFGNAFGAAGQGLQAQQAKQAELAQQNKTYEFFKTQAPEFAQMIDAGMPVPMAWQEYSKARTAKPTRNEYEERRAAAEQYGLQGDDATSFVLTGSLPTGRYGSAEVGLQPIPSYDGDGNISYVQPSKSGKAVPMQFPDGFKPMSPFDQSRQKSSGTETGKLEGGAAFDLPRVEQNAAQTLGVLERMKVHPGRSGSTGFVQGILPSRSSDQVDFQSLVDQTQGQSFLQAFQMLKGAGQITEVEGQKATQAISRLGNQRLSDEAYLRAIADLEEVIQAGLARARLQAGQGGSAVPAPQGGVDYKSKYGLD
jgi:hypothetical protein